MERFIYTLVRAADWEVAQALGEYRGSADDARDGFLHFSTAAQLRATAAKHRRGVSDLWMLEADTEALGGALRWEAASGSSRPGLFPHLYAALPVSAVTRAAAAPLGPDGVHRFPDDIP
ncbi:DUF952 domain-containing protein [Sabulicella rubraurantiaca]|uniref:DUF952 domain-containing protein n=1 Tax=Sabulicella rubraurantiaca TaxID=2811429 RepID=UPI001A966CC0|nr:DUF952 domain-containing protein [Sabulicella rubraurantiaca]